MKVKTLNQRHDDYDGFALQRYEALYCGGNEWHDLVGYWIPQNPDETPETYDLRKAAALYENHTGPIVDTIDGALFAQGPVVEDVEGDWLSKFQSNVDRQGTSLETWFGALVREALKGRRAYAWVNLPARLPDAPAPASRRDEESSGLLDAFLVAIDAESVIDWEVDESGALVWVMVRDQVSRRAAVDASRVKSWRWTYIDASVIRRWEWLPHNGIETPPDDDDAKELPAIAHGLAVLPVVPLVLPEGLHALGKLHDPAIAHIRGRNDLNWALHRGAHPLLWIKDKRDDSKPVLGPGRYLRMFDPAADIGYAEPSGASFELLAEDVVQRREALYRVVHQMAVGADSNAMRAKMSGDSKEQDWKALEIVLKALAALVRPVIGRTVAMVARARGLTVNPTISGLDGWEQEDLQTWLANAALAVDAHQLSMTYRKEVAKRQSRAVLADSPEEVLATIEKEIDTADPMLDVLMTPIPPEVPGAKSGSTPAGAGA